MFNCENCKQTSRAYVRPSKVVLETRQKSYTRWDDELHETVETGFGYEIIREENWCKDCVEKRAEAFLKGG